MIEINNLVTPSAEWWDAAIKGMRNPFKSRDKSDSGICDKYDSYNELCDNCLLVDHWEDEEPYSRPVCGYENPYDDPPVFVLGEEDKKLLLNLCKSGTSHRKVLRQLPVIMDIKAPLYFWKQLGQYKLGTVTNSESTMHTLAKKEFELSDFSTDYLDDVNSQIPFLKEDRTGTIYGFSGEEYLEKCIIPYLNDLRNEYLLLKFHLSNFKKGDRSLDNGFTWRFFEDSSECLTIEQLVKSAEEESKKWWYAINELLPQSYLQTRTWSANYEVLVNIIQQRKRHKLDEWNELINYWLEEVPYLKEIVEAIDGI